MIESEIVITLKMDLETFDHLNRVLNGAQRGGWEFSGYETEAEYCEYARKLSGELPSLEI